ncbi:MAG: FG-GAP repeat protein [Halapricum sp.]
MSTTENPDSTSVGTTAEPNHDGSGAAYIFEASGGSWSQQAKLIANDGDGGDLFGNSVGLSSDGTTAVIGASHDEDPNGEKTGSAYVFEPSGRSWNQQTKLTADDGDSGDRFGISVAVSGDGTTALVGAGLDDSPTKDDVGSAYVFKATGGSWTKRAKLIAPSGENGDIFGSSVALSNDGNTVLVGASGDDNPNGDVAGSAHIFEAKDGSWARGQHSKLVADDGGSRDNFARAVALSGDGTTALIGAESKLEMDSGSRGAAYAFEASSGSWSQKAKFTGDGETVRFGRSVAASNGGTTALIGDPLQLVTGSGMTGMAYVFPL